MRARAGDAWAEAAIYRRYARQLGNLAAKILANRDDALDVVHDVFVEVLDEFGALRDPSALRAWLLRRTVHQVHRRLRRRTWWRWFGKAAAEEVTVAMLATAACPPDLSLELQTLTQRLTKLPARQRIAWVLHRLEGETLPDVARACDVSLATVKRDIAAAEQTLQVPAHDPPEESP